MKIKTESKIKEVNKRIRIVETCALAIIVAIMISTVAILSANGAKSSIAFIPDAKGLDFTDNSYII